MLIPAHILAELGIAADKTIVLRHVPGVRHMRALMGMPRRRPDLLDVCRRDAWRQRRA